MALTDLPLEALRDYRPDIDEPAGFDEFWAATLRAAREHPLKPTFDPQHDTRLETVDVDDVRFSGWAGERVAAWLLVPRLAGPGRRLPAVVEFAGYTGGRGLPIDSLLYSAAGFAHLVVDSRGQGHATPDPSPDERGTQWVGGFMTRGIDDPARHYYRRLFTDCVRAVEAVRAHPRVDAERVVVAGGSQGGALALAVAGLAPHLVAGVLCDVPFLSNIRRGVDIAAEGPYLELVHYLGAHSRDDPERAFATLNHFDTVHHAARATAPALFSVALMDPICPPSTVFSAYNCYRGRKHIDVWQFADHRGGRGSQARNHLEWLAANGLSPTS
jgi:cephalosporin-C deacetylase